MKTNARFARRVSGLAALAMACVALGTAADAWLDRRDAASSASQQQSSRPAADAPVTVVRAPEEQPARQRPANCRDCPQRATGSSL